MKQTYAVILLTTIIFSTSCMEKKRESKSLFPKNPYADCTEIPLENLKKPITLILCTANEPGWEKYDEIMNMTYKREQSITTNEVVLTPIYRPATVNTNNTAKQPLLRTLIPVQPNADLIKELYDTAYLIIEYYHSKQIRLNGMIKDKYLSELVSKMNNAKNNGTNEDMMGKFAYDKSLSSFQPRYSKSIALVFSCLKRYFLAEEEAIPSISPLTYTALAKYPAYMALADSFTTINLVQNYYYINNCVSFLYSKEKDHPSVTYIDLKNEFYTKISDLFLCITSEKVYALLQMLDKAKKQKDIADEKDLGYAILCLQQKESIVTNLFTLINEKYSSSRAKNCASIFCTLAKEYNQARINKITPMYQQYACYVLYKSCNFTLPDDFDHNLLDEKNYALCEYTQLRDSILKLQDSDNQTIEQRVMQLYPPRT